MVRPRVVRPEAAVLRVRLLGGFRVWIGSREIAPPVWRLRKAAAIPKMLALAPGWRLHKEQIVETLWPDAEPEAAANSLHQVVHFARRTLEPNLPRMRDSSYLRAEGDLLRLDAPGGVWVDVEEFERLASTGDSRAQRQALELYIGDLLPEDRYEEWATAPRERLRVRFVTTGLAVAKSAAERGEVAFAEQVLRRVIDHDPTLEAAHVALIRMYLDRGDTQRAARQYAELEAALRDELGVEPSEEVQRLRDQVGGLLHLSRPRAEQRVVARRPPSNLPSPLTSFVGRKRETEEVAERVRSHRLVTLTGIGGVGKTRVALEVAKRGIAGPDGEVRFVDLSAAAEDQVPATVRAALGVREEPRRPDLEVLVEYLRGRRLLLVLDNCEHVLPASAALAEALLEASPELRLLTTSREPLGLPGEIVWSVPPMRLPPGAERGTATADLRHLAAFDAVALFVERAQLADPGFALTPANASAVQDLCRRLDGLPLAIELAAARLPALTPAAIVERLGDRFGLLTSSGRGRPSRHRTLRAALDWSYDLLDRPEQVLFARLSVFAGGCTLEAVEAVAADGLPGGEVLDLLSRLVGRSMLLVEEAPGGTVRYTLLETLRAYAAERLQALGEGAAVRRRNAHFFRDLAEQAAAALASTQPLVWLDRLAAEHDNLRTAAVWAAANDPESALRLVGALTRYAEMRGHVGEVRAWVDAALAAGDRAALPLRARALAAAGALARLVGDLREAAAGLEEALGLCERAADPALTGSVLNEMAVVAHMQGEYDRATALAGRSLDLLRGLGDRRGTATALNLLGLVAHHRGDFGRACTYLIETLAMARDLGDRRTVAVALNNLGSIAMYEQAYERARTYFEEALAIQRNLGNRRSVANLLSNLGEAARGLGAHDRALPLHRQALAERTALDDRAGIATSLLNLGYVAVATGDPTRAVLLLAAGDRVRHDVGMALPVSGQAEYEAHLATARARLEPAFEETWIRAQAMSREAAVALALGREPSADRAAGER